MEALCRITLLEAYRGDPSFRIPLGNGQRSLIPMGAVVSVTDPAFHVGFNEDQTGRPDANRFKAAEDIVYYLGLGEANSLMIPLSCAMIHFGDWSVKPGERVVMGVKRNYSQEKARVAGQWGDYLRMPCGKKTNNGVQPDTRIIGAPDIPKVKIELLEQHGGTSGEAYLPWKFYKWDLDIDANAVHEAKLIAAQNGMVAPQELPSFDLSRLSPELLDLIAAAMEKRGKEHRGGKTQGA